MRIATWNVNGLRARLDFFMEWLRDRKPDVVGIQELKLQEEQFPREAIMEAGYHAVIHGQKAWNGVAILTRHGTEAFRKGLPGQEDFGSRLVEARVGPLWFITVYCPNGKSVEHPDYERKLRWFGALSEYIASNHKPDSQVILCGDFNICPGPLDTFDEEKLKGTIFHTDPEREKFRSLLDWGFKDVFREKQPGVRAYSWWDYRAGAFPRNLGLRLDILLATASVLERAKSVEIDRDYRKKRGELKPSDHAPVMIDLEG
jgi:exodeoxyribonuclease III